MGKCWIPKFICFWSPFWYYNSILAWVADVICNSGYLACRTGTIFPPFFQGNKARGGREAWDTCDRVQRNTACLALLARLRSLALKTRETTLFCMLRLPTRGLFLESPGIFSGLDRCFVLVVFAFKIKVSIILKNNTIKLSVNEAKLTGLWDRNCATIQQVVILKFAFRPEKFPGLWRNGPQKFSFFCDAGGSIQFL